MIVLAAVLPLGNRSSSDTPGRAEPFLLRALAIYEGTTGAESPRVGDTVQNLGIIARQRKDYARAQELYQRALAIREKTVGVEKIS